MSLIITEKELLNDCSLLFGHVNGYAFDYLNNLQTTEIKAAFRKRAFESHPDRAKVLGEAEIDMDKRFKEVLLAYERLNSFKQGDIRYIKNTGTSTRKKYKNRPTKPVYKTAKKTSEKASKKSSGKAPENAYEKTSEKRHKKAHEKTSERPEHRKGVTDHFYKGYVPNRKLLIAQFLYYSGQISWRTLFDAICWQRKQRPPIGRIAMDWGILTLEDTKRILTGRSNKEKFAEYAWKNGYITYFELLAMVGKQRSLQRPIGEYFTQNEILCSEEIEEMVEKLKGHNIEILKRKYDTSCFFQ